MAGHFVALAALFAEAYPEPAAFAVNVFDFHAEGGADTGKAIDHQADERAIAQAARRGQVDAVEQFTSFGRFQDRCTALARAVLGSADRTGWVDRNHLAND